MPDKEKAGGSMFDTVAAVIETQEEHDYRIKQLEQSDKTQAADISILKSSDEEIMQELKSIKTDFTNLENTIWKTAQSTQDVMKTTTDRLWDMLGTRDANKHDIQKTRMTNFWEWLGKATVGGGIFIVALEMIFGK